MRHQTHAASSLALAEEQDIDRQFGLNSYHATPTVPGGLDLGRPLEPVEGTRENAPLSEERNVASCQSSQRTRIGSTTPKVISDEEDTSASSHLNGTAAQSIPPPVEKGDAGSANVTRKAMIASDMTDPGQEISVNGTAGEKAVVENGESERARRSEGDDVEITDDGYMLTREGEYIWVDFCLNSPRDPMHFSTNKKWTITTLACFFTLLTSTNLASYAAGEPGMQSALHMSSLSAAAGLALFAWGFAIFPLVLAPISEQYGRRPVFIVSVILWWVFYFPIAAGHSGALVLVFRFLQGGAGSVGATLSSGVVADVWATSERGSKMSFYALCAVLGSGIAPIFMSWVEQDLHNGWRWVQWIQIIVTGVYVPFVVIFLSETRSSLLLQRAAKRMRTDGGVEKGTAGLEKRAKQEKETALGPRCMARSEVNKPKLLQQMKVSCTRPLYLLVTEPVVLFMSIWLGVAWGVLYGEIEAIPYVFVKLYDFSHGQTGLVYISLVIGTFMAYFLNFYQEHLYKRHVGIKGAEARLYLAMAGGIVFAAGAFIFAWTSFPHVHWIAPCIGITVMICGIFSIYLAVFNYVADSYTIYASSALAAQSFLRNMLAGTFPLWVVQCYEGLGINWASTMFGCLAALLAVVPFVAFWYGPQIRARSKFSRKIIADEEELAEMKVEAMARRQNGGRSLAV